MITVTDKVELDQPAKMHIHSVPYRAGPGALVFQRNEKDKMVSTNFIEPAHTEWTSPVVLTTNEDETLPFCVENRKFHPVKLRGLDYLPRTGEWNDSLVDAILFDIGGLKSLTAKISRWRWSRKDLFYFLLRRTPVH